METSDIVTSERVDVDTTCWMVKAFSPVTQMAASGSQQSNHQRGNLFMSSPIGCYASEKKIHIPMATVRPTLREADAVPSFGTPSSEQPPRPGIVKFSTALLSPCITRRQFSVPLRDDETEDCSGALHGENGRGDIETRYFGRMGTTDRSIPDCTPTSGTPASSPSSGGSGGRRDSSPGEDQENRSPINIAIRGAKRKHASAADVRERGADTVRAILTMTPPAKIYRSELCYSGLATTRFSSTCQPRFCSGRAGSPCNG